MLFVFWCVCFLTRCLWVMNGQDFRKRYEKIMCMIVYECLSLKLRGSTSRIVDVRVRNGCRVSWRWNRTCFCPRWGALGCILNRRITRRCTWVLIMQIHRWRDILEALRSTPHPGRNHGIAGYLPIYLPIYLFICLACVRAWVCVAAHNEIPRARVVLVPHALTGSNHRRRQ